MSTTEPPNDQTQWIWQQPDWPGFTWDSNAIAASLRETIRLQGTLIGKVSALGHETNSTSELDAMLQNIIQSSAIEGETLNVESVRSSLARRLGIKHAGLSPTTPKSEGLVELLIDATSNIDKDLTLSRLFTWHQYLFPEKPEDEFQLQEINVGALRGEETMQVVSGPHNKRTLHFEAPPRTGLEQQVERFLDWLNSSKKNTSLDPILRAAIAHFWFVTLHPFDDGNGRLARAIGDYALAQADKQSIRFYAMAASIMEKREGYYNVLEKTQKGNLDITQWLEWFLETLQHSFNSAQTRIDDVMQKSRFWQLHANDNLNPEQTKVLNRLLDVGPGGFEGGLSAAKYQSLAKVSKATATRHLADLVKKKCIQQLKGGGRSTRYEICWPSDNQGV